MLNEVSLITNNCPQVQPLNDYRAVRYNISCKNKRGVAVKRSMTHSNHSYRGKLRSTFNS